MVDYSRIKNQSDFYGWKLRVDVDAKANRMYDRVFNREKDLDVINGTGWDVTQVWLIRNVFPPNRSPFEYLMKGMVAIERRHKRNQAILFDHWNENRFNEVMAWFTHQVAIRLPLISIKAEMLLPVVPEKEMQHTEKVLVLSTPVSPAVTETPPPYPLPLSMQGMAKNSLRFDKAIGVLIDTGNIEKDSRGSLVFIKGRRRGARYEAEALRLVLTEYQFFNAKNAELTLQMTVQILKNTFKGFSISTGHCTRKTKEALTVARSILDGF